MKILYVKANSERAKKYQLRTTVYEENGQRYVTKKAIHPNAIGHLKNMKETYKKLTDSIVNPNIKLAKIVKESNDSLTFEFINGTSLEDKYNAAKKLGETEVNKLLEYYKNLLQNGFKTTTFDSKTMVTQTFKDILGDFDYSEFDDTLCFNGISNIDLIFSNIIFKDDSIYLIDYEWVFDLNIPIDFSIFRMLHEANDLHWEIEKHFVFQEVVGDKGFLNLQKQYSHPRLEGIKDLEKKDDEIRNLNVIVDDKTSVISHKDVHIKDIEKTHNIIIHDKNIHIKNLKTTYDMIIHDKDVHIANQDTSIEHLQYSIHELAEIVESMRIKNRIKRLVKKFTPQPLWQLLKKIKETLHPTEPVLEDIAPAPINNYVYLEPHYTKIIEEEIATFEINPLISIIMPVYNVDPKWLELAINSIERQWYGNWELCLVDDKSTNIETYNYLKNINHPKIKVHFLEENLNISGASNAALTLTTGEYIALMDNDDELTPDALYEVVLAINNGAEFIYSDEDKIEMDGSYSDPHFKPDYAPDLFLSQNYLSHLGVIKKDLITKVNGFTIGLEGSQDFDLYLKVLEHTENIFHIDKVLYHWRKIPGSTASEYGEKSYAQEAGCKALENAMQRRSIDSKVKNGQTPGTFKVDYTLSMTPLVSIVIPFKDMPELLKTCIESILEKSTYQNYEIIGISNNSIDDATYNQMKYFENLDARISFYEYNVPFNYSDINNHAVKTYAKGEHILFLNNDIEIITPSWIEEMLMYSQQAKNGAIGAKLYFPNDTIQHAGLVMVPKTIHSAILMYQGYPKDHYGYISKLKCVNNYSAVTAACLMLKRTLFDELDGFDAERLSIAYNDVDLCLRIQKLGYTNVWTPYCEAYHHESISRGHEVKVADVERREKEKYHLKEKHPHIFTIGDPYYNKNLTRFGVGSEIGKSVSIEHTSVEGKTFYDEILFSQNISNQKHAQVCIFNHFDGENDVKEDVLFYLESLAKFTDIVFVSTAESLNEQALQSIMPLCKDIIIKKNIGYDFGAWKSGLDYLNTQEHTYQHIILCNDSVYGPLFDLKSIFDKMENYDFWAMTDNHEIEYHLQSYFMVYSQKAFTDPIFTNFWDNFKIYADKQTLIENNEIGFSKAMMDSDLTYSSYYQAKNKNYVNVLQYHWKSLIIDYKFPFIKKELLKRNPLSLNINDWDNVVKLSSSYDSNIIKKQLN